MFHLTIFHKDQYGSNLSMQLRTLHKTLLRLLINYEDIGKYEFTEYFEMVTIFIQY